MLLVENGQGFKFMERIRWLWNDLIAYAASQRALSGEYWGRCRWWRLLMGL